MTHRSTLRCWDWTTGTFKWSKTLDADGTAAGSLHIVGSTLVARLGDVVFGRRAAAADSEAWTFEAPDGARVLYVLVVGDRVHVVHGAPVPGGSSLLQDVAVTTMSASTGSVEGTRPVTSGTAAATLAGLTTATSGGVVTASPDGKSVNLLDLQTGTVSTTAVADVVPGAGPDVTVDALAPVEPASSDVDAVTTCAVEVRLSNGAQVVLGFGDASAATAYVSSHVGADAEVADVDTDAGSNDDAATPHLFFVGSADLDGVPDGVRAVFGAAATKDGVVVTALAASSASRVHVALLARLDASPTATASSMDLRSSALFPTVHLDAASAAAFIRGVQRVFFFSFARSSQPAALRALVVADDDTLSMVQDGQQAWSRPEYLASLTHVVSTDPPGNVVDHALDRVFVGLAQLQNGATKVVALQSASSAVVWETPAVLGAVPCRTSLHVSRAHAFDEAHNPEVMLVSVRDDVAGDGDDRWATRVTWMDAFTGATNDVHAVNVVARQVSAPPSALDDVHRQAVLVLGKDGTAHLLPPAPTVVDAFEVVRPSFVLRTGRPGDAGSAGLHGLHLAPVAGQAGSYVTQPLWSVALHPNHSVLAAAQPAGNEPSVNPAVVLGDDTLLIKYLNPNLVGVVSSTHAARGPVDSVLEVRLVDAVSGRVLQAKVHEHASGPTHAVRQSNWFIYTYWNTKAKRTEVGSFSVYEDSVGKFELSPLKPPPARPPFTSYAPTDPIILHKMFVMPRAIETLTVTRTRYGITTPHLLVGVHPGSVYSMNRAFVDPRRPVSAPTEAERREMLVQYMPYLPVIPTDVISYNQTLPRLRLIHAAPAAFESTTLVLAAGLDVFFTPATPAGAFDVLAQDFNKPLLAGMTGGLALVTVVLGLLAKWKTLRSRWA